MQLPVENEPLVLADGTKIDPVSGRVMKETTLVAIPANGEAQKIVARARKSVAELPLPPQQLSGVALVSFYTLYGLQDQDIAVALDGRLTTEQIKLIRETDAYQEFMQVAKANLLHTETNTVRELFEENAKKAAEKIVQLADSDVDVLAFKASQDVLDRAGHRPADIVEHRHTLENSLHIVVTKKDETKDVPYIDVDVKEVSNG